MVLAVAVFIFAAQLGTGDIAGFLLVCVLSGLALGTDLALPSALLAGAIQANGDLGKAEGAYFGWWNFATKLNLALAAGVALPVFGPAGLHARRSRVHRPCAPSPWPTACCPARSSCVAATLLYTLVLRTDTMKRRLLLAAAAATAAFTLGGCASQTIDAYANEKPLLDLQQYFNGTLDAYGVFTDRSGAVVKRFTVVMECSWSGDGGVLRRSALCTSDGSTQRRVWRLDQAQATAATPGAPMTWWARPQGRTRGQRIPLDLYPEPASRWQGLRGAV